MICGSVRTKHGRAMMCVRPSGHRIEQHHASDGKYWWYDDGFLRRRWVDRFEYCYAPVCV